LQTRCANEGMTYGTTDGLNPRNGFRALLSLGLMPRGPTSRRGPRRWSWNSLPVVELQSNCSGDTTGKGRTLTSLRSATWAIGCLTGLWKQPPTTPNCHTHKAQCRSCALQRGWDMEKRWAVP